MRNIYLTGLAGEYKGYSIKLDNGPVILGRNTKKCNLVFSRRGITISRIHCVIRYDEKDDKVTIMDISQNGVFLENHGRLRKNKIYNIKPDQKFYLSNKKTVFIIEEL
jgi:pSer/pThr/pTyr-binding forkhead associated (FHA) protein